MNRQHRSKPLYHRPQYHQEEMLFWYAFRHFSSSYFRQSRVVFEVAVNALLLVSSHVIDGSGLLSRPTCPLQLHQEGTLLLTLTKFTNHPFNSSITIVGLPVFEERHVDFNSCTSNLLLRSCALARIGFVRLGNRRSASRFGCSSGLCLCRRSSTRWTRGRGS